MDNINAEDTDWKNAMRGYKTLCESYIYENKYKLKYEQTLIPTEIAKMDELAFKQLIAKDSKLNQKYDNIQKEIFKLTADIKDISKDIENKLNERIPIRHRR